MNKVGLGSQIQVVGLVDDVTGYEHDVVIPLNIEWDSAALGLHSCFITDVEWVFKTVEYILENTNATVAVREHPAGRHFPDHHQNVERLLTTTFGKHPNFTFYSKRSAVNSYRLIKKSRLVLPHSSTIGIEAAMQLPVCSKILTTCSGFTCAILGMMPSPVFDA